MIIYGNCKIISWNIIFFYNYLVFDIVRFKGNFFFNYVIESICLIFRYMEMN